MTSSYEPEQFHPGPGVDPGADPAAQDRDLEDGDFVGGLFRDVDGRAARLEQQYLDARRDLSTGEPVPRDQREDPIAASTARFELIEEVATLRADVERQAAELDERDRMLGELSERLLDFETRHRAAGDAAEQAEVLRLQLHERQRELSRAEALLDASLAEREELAGVAQRLQQDNDALEQRMLLAIERFEEVEQSRSSLAAGVAELEAAHAAESADHQTRAEELQAARAEVRRLSEIVDELSEAREEAVKRADRVEHDVERRANEVGYLNRRIDALTERANASDALESRIREMGGEQALLKRTIGDLERALEVKTAEAAAATRAVEALADRTADNDALRERVRQLEVPTSGPAGSEAAADLDADTESNELRALASRARALGERRAADRSAEPDAATDQEAAPAQPREVAPTSTAAVSRPDLSHLPPPPAPPSAAPAAPQISLTPPADTEPAASSPAGVPQIVIPTIAAPGADAALPSAPVVTPPTSTPPSSIPLASTPAAGDAPAIGVSGEQRRRLVLPAEMRPDTPEAVEYLLAQPRLTAIVDARSVCARTGLRPTALFEQLAGLRDRFDLPIDVVVTPVSTPVGGAPEHPGIGVHQVTGADTVADRVRALCMGFPADEQLVVIAADDHVRRAAISQEANIVDPAVVLDLA